MAPSNKKNDLTSLEIRTLKIGFILSGIVIGVVAVSYLVNSPFSIRWLVWAIGVAFGAVALLSLEWSRSFPGKRGEAPKGRFRQFLLIAMPLAFILDSQICGLGLKACSVVCHLISYSSIGLSAFIAYRIYKDQSIGAFLIPLIVIALIPHCVCEAPINILWENLIGIAPTCQVIPLTATLFSIAALNGMRTRFSATMVVVLLVVTAFIAVGNAIWGFPWQGCTYLGT